MRVVLSSNCWHYHHAAQALESAGMLDRYITTVLPDRVPRALLPTRWREKLDGRELRGVPAHKVVSLALPEAVHKAMCAARVFPMDRAHWVQNWLFDRMARAHVGHCDVFHFVSGLGLLSARRAARRGAIVICDERMEHPDHQRRLLEAEHARLGIPYRPEGLPYDAKVKAEYRLSDYLIVGSRYARQTYVDAGWHPKRVFVVPYGFDPTQFHPGGEEPGRFRILYVGQIIPRKGLHHLVEAFSRLRLPHAELWLVGPAEAGFGRRLVARAVADPNIRLFGAVPKSRLREFYQRASVFVMPSLSDSFGLVCLEAMGCGLPVITTFTSGAGELLRDELDGFRIHAGDIEALANRLLTLYRHGELRREMGRSARERATRFSWSTYQERLLEVYGQICGRPQARVEEQMAGGRR